MLSILAIGGCRPERKSTSVPKSDPRPNIVFVVYDNTRADRYSINGNTRPTSPFFEKLASEGTFAPHGISPATWTIPSHASMFTGYCNHRLKVDNPHRNRLPPEAGIATIAQILKRHGYFTVSYPDHPYFSPIDSALNRGFDRFDILLNPLETPAVAVSNTPGGALQNSRKRVAAQTHEDARAVEREHDRRLGTGRATYLRPDPKTERFPTVDQYVERYAEQRYSDLIPTLQQANGRPFFLYVNLHNDVQHLTTMNDNNRWFIEYLEANGLGPVPTLAFERADNAFLKSDYVIAFSDATLKWLYKKITSTPGLEDTVFIVTSDHGQAHAEHEEDVFHKHANAIPWHYLVSVPALIHFPANRRDAHPPQRIDARVSTTDLFYTVADIAECDDDADVQRAAGGDKRSLLARVREKQYDDVVVTEAYAEFKYRELAALLPELETVHNLSPSQPLLAKTYAVYRDRFKLIYAPQCIVDTPEDGAPQIFEIVLLFDLVADPNERVNLASERPDIVSALMKVCREHIDAERAFEIKAEPRPAVDEDLARQLRALGYAE